ncbi:MAG: isocitrate lyase/PEP mutase family protein [Pseudomonadota bacterium]
MSGTKLRAALAEGLVVAPFVYDGFTARIAASHGAKALYMTGHGTAAQLGFPDVGLVGLNEMVGNLGYIVNAVDIPVIADADTGYGNAISVQRAVREYELAGAAAMHLEDQVFPKRCGFFEGKAVIPIAEHVQKISAALDARLNDDFVIIARTDALAPNGWEDALTRARAYREAGADAVFVDGIKTNDDLQRYASELAADGIPCLYNGALATTDEVASMGFKVMITGGGHALSYAAVRQQLLELKAGQGASAERDQAQFDAMTGLLGLPEVYELERRYSAEPGDD